jgi:hypothetical protein
LEDGEACNRVSGTVHLVWMYVQQGMTLSTAPNCRLACGGQGMHAASWCGGANAGWRRPALGKTDKGFVDWSRSRCDRCEQRCRFLREGRTEHIWLVLVRTGDRCLGGTWEGLHCWPAWLHYCLSCDGWSPNRDGTPHGCCKSDWWSGCSNCRPSIRVSSSSCGASEHSFAGAGGTPFYRRDPGPGWRRGGWTKFKPFHGRGCVGLRVWCTTIRHWFCSVLTSLLKHELRLSSRVKGNNSARGIVEEHVDSKSDPDIQLFIGSEVHGLFVYFHHCWLQRCRSSAHRGWWQKEHQ